MKGGYHSFETIWTYLEENGLFSNGGSALLLTMLVGGALLVGVRIFQQNRQSRILVRRKSARIQKQIKTLRTQGQLEGDFTYADALELAETGTVRVKSLEDKIVNCLVPIEILFYDTEHDITYQFEMEHHSEKEVAAWVEVAQALKLTDISKILEEVLLMRNVVCHPEYETADETVRYKLRERALELHDEFARINGVERLRFASKSYLSKYAPHMLPLPTW